MAVFCLASSPVGARDDALYAAAQAEHASVIETLRTLTSVDSGTGQAEGLGFVTATLEARLKALGATTERRSAAPSVGVNLIGRLSGKGQRKLMMMAHMDTIYPAGTAAARQFRIDGNRAIAPGIADAKGGAATLLHALKVLKARGFDDYALITVLFNPDEEVGSPGSGKLISELAAQHDAVLSFEPSGERDIVLLGASGAASVTVEVKGKASHAGVAPELGINALVELSDLVLRTLDLDDPKRNLRFNWTLAAGGEVVNAIPEKAWARANVRFIRNEDLDALVATLRERLARKRLDGAEVTLSVQHARPAFSANAGGLLLAEKARGIYAEMSAPLLVIHNTGGSTDAGYAALSGKPVIESLGLSGGGYHSSNEEFILIDSIPRRLYLAMRLMTDILQGK